MADQVIRLPNPNEPNVFKRVVLDGTSYIMRFDWIERINLWSFSLLTENGDPISSSIALTANWKINYTIRDPRGPRGLLILGMADGTDPTIDTLKDAIFLYRPEAEV